MSGFAEETNQRLFNVNSTRIWAVIIGVDVYNDPSTPDLSGACADAWEMRKYLRDLAVPSARISLLISEAVPVYESFNHYTSLDSVNYTRDYISTNNSDNTDTDSSCEYSI